MNEMDKMFFLGIIAGIVIAFLYDQVSKHQRRKKRERYQKAARSWKI